MTDSGGLLGASAPLHLVGRVGLLQPEEQVFEAMLEGWAVQQQARFLAPATIAARASVVRRLGRWANEYPWRWRPVDLEEWIGAGVSEKGLAFTTVRDREIAVRLFMEYICDARYGWAEVCEDRFGDHPVQICHERNSVVHRSEFEGRPERRPLTRSELQDLLDAADARVGVLRRRGRKGALAAFRDATLLKVIYAWGLRRREAVMLDVADLAANPHAREFGRLGVVRVRYGKASSGGPPRRRAVLTTMPWAAEVLGEYLAEVRPRYGAGVGGVLFPTERGGRVAGANVAKVFARLRDEVGLPAVLGPHCLRHSYVTHLLEDGWDPLFVQQQVGHAWASTTAIYTGVGSDFKNTMLRASLDRVLVTDKGKD